MASPPKRKPRNRQQTDGTLAQATLSHDAVARRAYELFVARGRTHGRDLQDWLEAERQLSTDPIAGILQIENSALGLSRKTRTGSA